MSGGVTSSSVFYAEKSLPVANGSAAPTLLICFPHIPSCLQGFATIYTSTYPLYHSFLCCSHQLFIKSQLKYHLLKKDTSYSSVCNGFTCFFSLSPWVFLPLVFFCYKVPSWLCMRLLIYLRPSFNGEQNFFYFIFFCIFNTFQDNRCLLNICGMDEGEKNWLGKRTVQRALQNIILGKVLKDCISLK